MANQESSPHWPCKAPGTQHVESFFSCLILQPCHQNQWQIWFKQKYKIQKLHFVYISLQRWQFWSSTVTDFFESLYKETCLMSSLKIKLNRVCTLFWTKNSRTFWGRWGTHLPFFNDSIQCKNEPWIYVFSSTSSHEQFYPEGLSMFASFRHLRIWVG